MLKKHFVWGSPLLALGLMVVPATSEADDFTTGQMITYLSATAPGGAVPGMGRAVGSLRCGGRGR